MSQSGARRAGAPGAAIGFAQYRPSTYSSVPGGDLEKMSTADPVIRICMCGLPVAPNIGSANIATLVNVGDYAESICRTRLGFRGA
jgi:hypothetical protein